VVNVDNMDHINNGELSGYFKERNITLHPIKGYEVLKEHMQGSFLFLNVLILGAMCGRDLGDFSLEELKEAVSELSPDRFRDLNLKAVDLGFREMKNK